MRSRVLVVALGGILSACGLSVTGQLEVGEEGGAPPPGSDGSTSNDSGTQTGDASVGDSSVDAFDATLACDGGLGGATLVIVPANGDACPSGTIEQTVQTAPTPVAGACSCGTCSVSAEPSCAGANFSVTYAANNACGGGPLTYSPANNTCTDFNQGTFTLNVYHRWTARTPAPGACTAGAVTDATKVTSTAIKTCTATNSEVACQSAPAGARRCIESAGACGGTFSVPLVVGGAPTVSCAACGCSRTGTTCTVDYHGNSTCTDFKYTINANNVCTATNGASGVNHFKVYATGLACNTTPGAATAALTNAKTLCCMP